MVVTRGYRLEQTRTGVVLSERRYVTFLQCRVTV